MVYRGGASEGRKCVEKETGVVSVGCSVSMLRLREEKEILNI